MNRKLSLNDFSVTIELPVLWGDMDAFQHVNNVRFFRYFECARIEYINHLGLDRICLNAKIGPILAETSCKYIAPLTYPDTITVGCRSVSISSATIEQEYLITSGRDKATSAVGKGLIVAYDYQELKKTSFPREVIETICDFESISPGQA
jgi:acyl-CoA thioester hydrolase